MIDAILLRELLFVEHETGFLFWKRRAVSLFPTAQASAAWNARHVGRQAFTTIGTSGYYEGRIFRKLYRAHRVVFAMVHGKWPEDEVDHINGDRLDNRPLNLRAATRVENGRNQKLPIDNRSGVIGVSWFARDHKWQAFIVEDGRKAHLGYFTEKSAAVAARKAAEHRLGFHENHGRPQ